MATANGSLTPSSPPHAPASPSVAKRKRTDPDVEAPNGATGDAPETLVNGASHSLQTVLEDILSVLKSYDTQPSTLAHPVTTSASRLASGESDSKRTKLSPSAGSSIASLIQGGSYHSLETLEKDVENATADILASIGSSELSHVPASPEETRLQANVLAFRKLLKNLITREQSRKAHVEAKKVAADKDEQSLHIKEEELPDSRTVLTLYGSAQGPKQLFSSLQQPRSISSADASSTLDNPVKVTLPLRESTLPNFISTTEVFPMPDAVDDKKKGNVTIGKVFKAPAHLPQLAPPKLAKPLTTKGGTVTFAPPEPPKLSRKGSQPFANQNLSAGNWLGYGGVDMPRDPTSPTAKQKSRQRALSTGEAQQPSPGITLAAVKHAKEDALFRSAYSSFAPTRDNASAVIPEETKNMIWWQKVGERRFNEVFPIDPELLGNSESSGDSVEKVSEEEDIAFKEAADAFEPIKGGPLPDPKETSDFDKGTGEILHEVSDLLETLASHQRIRNSSLATNPRTPVIQNASLANLAGSPSTPSSEEVDVYQVLKSQLTLMVAQLPPYAVAKLNGDQLDELNICRTILIENKDTRGVLEEDQLSRLTRAPAAAPVAPPNLSRMTSSGSGTHAHHPSTSSQYARPAPSVHSSARPASTSQSYFPQQQPIHRSPSVHYSRSSSGLTQGFQPQATSYASTPRQSYSANQSYSQQTPRAQYGQPAPVPQYSSQRPAQSSTFGGAAASQYFASTPQTQPHSRFPPQAQNGYYQRAQNVAPMYGATPIAHGRTASPLKAAPTPGQPSYGSRGAYGTPVQGAQVRSTYYPPSQYGQPQTPAAAATPGHSANPQQMMLERQQATQTQARLAAQSSFTKQDSGTPQPPPNGQYSGQSNGTPMAT